MKKRWIFILVMMETMIMGCQTSAPMYRGYTFDAEIAGARVVELRHPDKIPALQEYPREVHWRLDKPIGGDFDRIILHENNLSEGFIGHIIEREPMDIIFLQDTDVATDTGETIDETVRFGGAAATGKAEFLRENHLPKGDYIFRLKVHGTNNWDRKEIYIQVR